MKEVKVSTFIEDGILKVHVMRITREENQEAAKVESLNLDGTWEPANIYMRGSAGVFAVTKGQSEAHE